MLLFLSNKRRVREITRLPTRFIENTGGIWNFGIQNDNCLERKIFEGRKGENQGRYKQMKTERKCFKEERMNRKGKRINLRNNVIFNNLITLRLQYNEHNPFDVPRYYGNRNVVL